MLLNARLVKVNLDENDIVKLVKMTDVNDKLKKID